MGLVQQHLATAAQRGRVLVRISWALAVLVLLLVAGTLGFMYFGPTNTTAFDAFYMTAITITTVGYGEMVDLSASQPGRAFAAFVSFAGFGTVTFIFSSLTVFFLETDLNEALRRRRMEKTIRKLHGHYIVCGFGRVGRNVATELLATHHRFVTIDPNPVEIEPFLERHPGVRIVARCHEVRNADKMRKAGADVVVSPDFTGGMRIASSMIRPQVVSFLDEMLRSAMNTRIDEVVVPQGFEGCTVADLGRRSEHYVLLGVRAGPQMQINPPDDFRIEAGQVLILMGSASGRSELESALR